MARTRERSPSPDSAQSALKRLKTGHTLSSVPQATIQSPNHLPTPPTDTSTESLIMTSQEPSSQFANDLFDHNNIARLNTDYSQNTPFKYTVVEKLFQDDLLEKVKDECLGELNFTEKETDIYKIARLTNLLALRDALYSPQFRKFLRAVTGCGPLSGKKQDMSVNSYTRGCHLLNHDDVIGTRQRLGGALELYPTRINAEGQPEPVNIPSKSIPPSWNQFIFFEVQPGQSFHSVEEVVVGERLSISGWFHAAQEGEEGYVPEAPEPEVKSSREQLTSTSTIFKSYPMQDIDVDVLHDVSLSDDHISFLSEFLNPVYLQPRTMKALAARFAEESSLELHSFLSNPLAEALEPRLRELDTRDGLGENRVGIIPAHTSGTGGAWIIRGPPHKWRYCVLSPLQDGAPVEAVRPRHLSSTDQILRSLQEELLMPMRYAAEARRFRPGLDYTLATSEESEARLDVVLGLTPPAREAESDEESDRFAQHQRGWTDTEWGGWECYMAPHNEEDDPAIYRSGSHKKSKPPMSRTVSGDSAASTSSLKTAEGVDGAQLQEEDAMDEDDEDDSTLLAVQPGFNRLLLVLRDERVMRFVKYVSAAAEGSRWDICGEYEVGMIQEDAEDDDTASS
ncbi:Oxoglutarate and iron-dependent oxygenase degradation C-term-domain-containing protein [Gymnopilus junonius]|uniref:Oxoglutarate and iron-dependent oxygenase degradation C-term-domain-containing protein n=1 Tax=Gymnopilus junonius TaxID=109634 RepID=A0A9P5P2R9_GYMJU|nr:Oxoglutarate and iron-dependent oxygenase degradation C-term-domain-containing protein [Gymnopilus junonius]